MTTIHFETAFKRLEEILEKMNAATATLDESLKLYEEADQLIVVCQKKLSLAETKIEMLTKKRDGTLALDEHQEPLSEALPR